VDVLELVAQGFSNEEIAAQLGLRPNTVKFHISEIFRRLGVRNRIEAIAHADRDGALAP
jgi:DNA-binding NarL/FixJ family response regulator